MREGIRRAGKDRRQSGGDERARDLSTHNTRHKKQLCVHRRAGKTERQMICSYQQIPSRNRTLVPFLVSMNQNLPETENHLRFERVSLERLVEKGKSLGCISKVTQ